ncbi:Uncharacterised protein [Mycobacteroides abscessus subsp. abscessus]|nr:Uncharacterised protein [Mycobacteroides abscessus subsp. abscessus]
MMLWTIWDSSCFIPARSSSILPGERPKLLIQPGNIIRLQFRNQSLELLFIRFF